MAYASAKSRNQQLASVAMVAALHVAVGAVLVTTFAGGFAEVFTKPFTAVKLTPDKPLPPPPVPDAKTATDDSVVVIPKAAFTLAPANPDNLIIPDTGTNDTLTFTVPTGPTGVAADPSPTPSSSYVPQVARPKTSPATWATTMDYPARALRAGRSGATTFRVTVGADGLVSECMIIRSSGSPDLDEATCAKVSKRAKFEPATDASGNKVSGSYTNTIRWQIPE